MPQIEDVAKNPEKFGYKKITDLNTESFYTKTKLNIPNFIVYYNEKSNSTYAIKKKFDKSNVSLTFGPKYFFKSEDCIMSGVMAIQQDPIIADDSGDIDRRFGIINIMLVDEFIRYGETIGIHTDNPNVNWIAGMGTFRLFNYDYIQMLNNAIEVSPEGWIFRVNP